MTDNEIIKALECCSIDNHIGVCAECPFTEECDKDEQALQKNALDLINRLKAEIKEKDIEIDILIKKKDAAYDECSELKARNDELNSLNKTVAIEVIKEFVKEFKALFEQYGDYDTLHIYEIKDRIDIIEETMTEGREGKQCQQ